MYFGGIDPSGSGIRPSGCAVLDNDLRVAGLGKIHTDEEIVSFFRPYNRNLYAIGLDGPCKLPSGLHLCCFNSQTPACGHQQIEGRKGRFCERELSRRGIGCFYVTPKAFAKDWIHRSLTLYERLTERGFNVLEVYPYGTKRRLFGKHLPPKTTIHGRQFLQEKIQALGIKLNEPRLCSHDELDAVLSAYTCYLHKQEKTEEIGDEAEGKIILPRPLISQ